MTRFFLGAGALRILKNDGDDPETTPASAVDKFAFDSRVNDLGYAVQTYVAAPGLANGYYPAGTDASDFVFSKSDFLGADVYEFSGNRFLTGYSYPLYVDAHFRNPDTGCYAIYFQEEFFRAKTGYSYGRVTSGYYDQHPYTNYDDDDHNLIFDGARYNVWTIPCDRAFPPPSAAPAAGQQNVAIHPGAVKISRPGFDVRSASGRQLIADSDRIPAKLLRSGSIAAISSGGYVDVPIGFSVPANTFVDAQFSDYDMAEFTLPGCKQYGGSGELRLSIEYELINSNKVRFHNRSDYQVKGRYLIFGSGDGPSAGNCPVLRRVEGAPDYVQLVRPGAANPPHWDDIIADTRASYLPLIATGYIPKSSFAANDYLLTKTVNVSLPAGMVAYVKAIWQSSGAKPYGYPTYQHTWNGDQRLGSAPGPDNRLVVIDGGSITFHAQTKGLYSLDSDGTNWQDTDFTGLVYHVFAVPETF